MSSKASTLQAPPATDKAVRTATRPTEEQIALRAHQIFLERGAKPGSDLDDWLKAERELTTVAKPSDSARPSAPPAAPAANLRSRR